MSFISRSLTLSTPTEKGLNRRTDRRMGHAQSQHTEGRLRDVGPEDLESKQGLGQAVVTMAISVLHSHQELCQW